MNNVEYFLLTQIKNKKKYLRDFIINPHATPVETDAVLKTLKADGLIQYQDDAGPYSLTPKGIKDLITENEQRSKLEQQKQQNDNDIESKLADIVLKLEKNPSEDIKVSVKESFISSLIGKLVELLHILIKLFLKRFFML